MTIKEIKELRVQQEEIRQDNCKESQQALKQLDELEQKAHDDLVKKIAKHFKGIKPTIYLDEHYIKVNVNEDSMLYYGVGRFTWNKHITSKLAHTIKGEYEEVYGEPRECCNAIFVNCKPITTVGQNLYDAYDSLLYSNFLTTTSR